MSSDRTREDAWATQVAMAKTSGLEIPPDEEQPCECGIALEIGDPRRCTRSATKVADVDGDLAMYACDEHAAEVAGAEWKDVARG